jgi:hypothetical protein
MTGRYDIRLFEKEETARNIGVYDAGLILERVKGIESGTCFQWRA